MQDSEFAAVVAARAPLLSAGGGPSTGAQLAFANRRDSKYVLAMKRWLFALVAIPLFWPTALRAEA